VKPMTTNARYRVETQYPRPNLYKVIEGKWGYVGCVEKRADEWYWYCSNQNLGYAPTAQAAMDALVAAYEGNGEAGE
jgi:hypothetical protein